MKRILLQVYVKDSKRAAKLYSKAFNAELQNVYTHEDGTFIHAEIDLHSCVLSLSENEEEINIGNNMQYCIQFGHGNEQPLKNAFSILSSECTLLHPLGECFYSPLMVDFIDQFGIRWCFFI